MRLEQGQRFELPGRWQIAAVADLEEPQPAQRGDRVKRVNRAALLQPQVLQWRAGLEPTEQLAPLAV